MSQQQQHQEISSRQLDTSSKSELLALAPQSSSLTLKYPSNIESLSKPVQNHVYPLYSTPTPTFLSDFKFKQNNQTFRFTNKGSKIQIAPADDSPVSINLGSGSKPTLKRLHSSTTLSRHPAEDSPYFVSQQNPFKRVFPETTPSSANALEISASSPVLAEPLQPTSSLVQRPTPVPMECAEGETSPLAELDTTSDNASVPPLPSPAKSLYDEDDDNASDNIDNNISNNAITSNSITEPPMSPNSSIRSFASIYDFYLSMPKEMQRATLRKLISVTDRNTLSIVSQNIVPSLRCDFMDCLPSELILKILSDLDFRSLCRAAQVSRRWRTTVDSSEAIWRKRLTDDDLYFDQKDLRRAASEKWDYTSWGTTNGTTATKTFNDPYAPKINIYKAVYRRRYMIINRNWMDSRFKPKRLTITGNGGDVVTCLQFDDNKIITGSDDHSITIHNMDTGEVIRQLLGHTGGVWALQYVGNLVVSGSTDRSVCVWDTRTGVNTHMFTGHMSTVRCLEVLLPVEVGTDPETHQPIMEPEHALIVTGSRDATLKVWRLPDESSTTTAPPPENGDNYFLRTLQGHSSSVRALSGHGNTVVSGSYDTTVRVWNVETGECRWVLTGHNQRVYSAVLDYKRNRCISGSMDWYVKVWSLDNGSLLYTLEGHTSLVGLLDLNRTTLVSAAADSTLRVWDPDNGAFLHKLEGHQGAITCFQHDEYKVVSGSENTLKLWNIKTGKLVQDLLDGLSRIWQVRFDQRKCIAAVQRNNRTFIEVLDFDQDPNLPENQNPR